MHRLAYSTILALGAVSFIGVNGFAIDLSSQQPIEIRINLGKEGVDEHKYFPDKLNLETGKLYKVVLYNPSNSPHYFSSADLGSKVWTRKAQVMDESGSTRKAVAEIKGALREIEVYPGGTAEWWFVPVATGTAAIICTSKDKKDNKPHFEHGMRATAVIN